MIAPRTFAWTLAAALLGGCASTEEKPSEAPAQEAALPPIAPAGEPWAYPEAQMLIHRDPTRSDVAHIRASDVFAVGLAPARQVIAVTLRWESQDGEVHRYSVRFEFDSYALSPGYQEGLRRFFAERQGQPRQLLIEGRADDRGTLEYNQGLSERRAVAVKRFVMGALGIEEPRIVVRALGEEHPVASNDTEEGRAANRSASVRWIAD